MALDEATTAFLTRMAENDGKPLHEMTPAEARGLMASLGEMSGPGPEVARSEDADITTEDGSFPVRVLVPNDSPRAVIVYYHGGGWVIGDIDGCDTLGRTLAQRTGCAVVLVDYRLAPEHRYPTAVEDSWAALCWVDEHMADIAGGRVPLIVAGDSAGGNLSAIMAQRARDNGGLDIALQVLVYPVTDCDVDNASYVDPENQLMLTRDSMIWFWDHYAPEAASRRNVDACPGLATDLSGLPPAVVLTAEHDVLREEGEAYAERLREAGVPVRHRRFDGQMHGFFTMVNVLPGSAAGIEYVTEEIGQHLTSQPSLA
ncbi:acetyl esterase [Halopolyspora algeriensis]|uniref:Acetyl esterase n=1 Tax=Halopolyspora algeriensis TaxID=1500506 RepID=A0A368VH54_9ACTN|nr:alpha/beta hydrolase [Halopolyspora algeriensis]RCW40719.1 acetyl esterase [Halopolyspora algeriensis]TQM53358.1 acetyl esterase [Halopolyspora algeriensis]